MTRERWNETWHRLREWTDGQAPSEGLAAQLLLFDGYENVDPVHPHGGPDGGKDLLCTKDGLRCLVAVYFPRGQQKLTKIKSKFRGDFQKAKSQQPPINRFLFVTNQELRLAEPALLEELNRKIVAGDLRNRTSKTVSEKLGEALVRADGKLLYPIRNGIPVMLVDEGIPLGASGSVKDE